MSKAYRINVVAKGMLEKIIKNLAFLGVVFYVLLPQEKLIADAIDYETKKMQIVMGTEPPDLNYLKATDQVSFFIIEHVMEGLLAYGPKGELIPGIAERWEINEKGATFYLRKNAVWSDGIAVTAHDFVFAWQTVANPKTASRYSFILAPIKNAESITAGELSPSLLGVKAKKELMLEKFPPIVLLSSESSIATKQAEYLQALFKDALGLNIKIDKQIFKQRLAKMAAGEFELVLGGWGHDYNDPSTFGDLFYSNTNNNHGQYKNKLYDYRVEQAMNKKEKQHPVAALY